MMFTAPPTEFELAKPRLTRRGFYLTLAVWTLYTIFYATLLKVWAQAPFISTLAESAKENFVLAILTLPVWWWIVRGMDGKAWGLILASHIIVGVIFCFVWSELYLFVTMQVIVAHETMYHEFIKYRAWHYLSHLTIYAVQFSFFHIVRSSQRLREQERRAEIFAALARTSELAALKSQINPHFLFNALNSISASVPDELEQTRSMVRRLASLLRYALDSNGAKLVPLQKELNFVHDYLELEKERFGHRLNFLIESDEFAAAFKVPPMILQPLVENAVRHGIGPNVNGGTVWLTLAENENSVFISVRDDGPGAATSNLADLFKNGMGLKNTDARLRLAFGENAGLQFETPDGGGFQISCHLPNTKNIGAP